MAKSRLKGPLLIIGLAFSAIFMLCCLCLVGTAIYNETPAGKANLERIYTTQTAEAFVPSSTPTLTPSSTATPTLTPSQTSTPTSTKTSTPTSTPTPLPPDLQTATSVAETETALNIGRTATSTAATATADAYNAVRTATQAAINSAATSTSIARTQTQVAVHATATEIASYEEIDWRELITYPEDHVGEKVIVRGVIFNVNGRSEFQMYISGTYEAVYVVMMDNYTGLYEDVRVVVYGIVEGETCGTNAFGAEICQPLITGVFLGE